eukprot:TRINITY_DN7682_c0_g1_i1.p1 TRINITY_DN7682_c0_g1~~TRINITY_DN7682_c0_g1_i1.p1  ORF type:complete len:920 (-),score=198.74 TRINITY_DN7682_c0_g1_i1:189-2948(-)
MGDRKSKKMTIRKLFGGGKSSTTSELIASPPPSSASAPSAAVSALVSPRQMPSSPYNTSKSVIFDDGAVDTKPTQHFETDPPSPAPLTTRPQSTRPATPTGGLPPTPPRTALPPPPLNASAPSLSTPTSPQPRPFKQSHAHASAPIVPIQRKALPPPPDRPSSGVPPTPSSKLAGTPNATPASPTPSPLRSGTMSSGSSPVSPAPSSPVPTPASTPATPPPPPEPEPSPEELAKMMEKRTHIAKELLSTEQSYVRSLKIIITCYMTPLLQWVDTEKSEVNKAELKQIFLNVDMIVSIHNELLKNLEEKLNNWRESQILGDIFMRIAPFMKMYNEYANNYEQAANLLASKLVIKEGKVNVFAQKLWELEQASGEGNPLPSLIIMPIQRIPRYNLLLADLLKNTPRNHADRDKISNALEKMAETANYINNNIRDAENNKKLMKLAAGNKGAKGIIAPHRQLVREGVFFDKAKKQNLYIWLFNDIVVHMSENKAKNLKNMESPNYQWPLSLVWINENVNYGDSATAGCWFELQGPMNSYVLKAATPEDKYKFCSDTKTAINKLGVNADSVERSSAYVFTSGPLTGGRYEGTWMNGRLTGKGTLAHLENTYEGDFENNKKSGTGIMKYVTGEVYEGSWRNNKPHGIGVLTYPNGDVYRGDWEEGLKSGKGEYLFANGDQYSGEWHEGFATGQGVLTTSHLTYSGSWLEDRYHGRGSLVHSNGRKYEGEFAAGQKHGTGVLTYGNGDMYRGTFNHDMRHGSGVCVSEEGVYDGEWDSDFPHGFGKMVYSSGDTYEGYWHRGQRQGAGIMTYTRGTFTKYDGEWAGHVQAGKGVLDYRNGIRYEGMFKAGKQHGAGVLLYPGGLRIEGKWHGGEFDGKIQVGRGIMKKEQEPIFAGTYKEGFLIHEDTMFDIAPRQPCFNVFAKD